MALHVVLVEPEIPPNTGNIARSCAATGTVLRLEDFLEEYGERSGRMFLATTKGDKLYTEIDFADEDMILFGRETAGLPRDFIEERKENAIRIPMGEDARLRSLNLANSVNIILFEALRQLGFPELG